VPSRLSEFGDFCRLAYAWGMCGNEINQHTTCIAEELADVTSPGKAPETWGVMLRQGLGWGMNIYGVSQRPAESDKTIMGNLTFIHAHFMSRAQDRKYIAEEMDINPDDIKALEQYKWIESWAGREIKRG